MIMQVNQVDILGAFELIPIIHKDERGNFIKIFNVDTYRENHLETYFEEEYYTYSVKGVLRGLHFQSPPMDYTKVVYCVLGQVKDAIVDLRVGSPTFGKFKLFDLNSDKGNIIYIPPGIAHGFYVESENAILAYNVSKVYSPKHDTGIRWDSVGIPWQNKKPIISKRDREFLPFSDFVSPFTMRNSRKE
jgi:dTDP-4-dehydrorhamnose 3,5-epimerase